MRTSLLSALAVAAGCGGNTLTVGGYPSAGSPTAALSIPFALLASNQLRESGTCGYSPVPITTEGPWVEQGMLELDPVLNPSASYTLGLQVENYLVAGAGNDFHPTTAIVNFIDVEGQIGPTTAAEIPISGGVPSGGQAAAIQVTAVGNDVASVWSAILAGNGSDGYLAAEDMILEVQLIGTLGSGASAASNLFGFPLLLCFGCDDLPLTLDGGSVYVPDCPQGTTAVPSAGPCCAPQDFADTCVPCGEAGEPCCGSVSGACNSPAATCTPIALPATSCNYPLEPTHLCILPDAG